jgi:hypothetical protein
MLESKTLKAGGGVSKRTSDGDAHRNELAKHDSNGQINTKNRSYYLLIQMNAKQIKIVNYIY